jgi:ubiquinone/menaquinone biosynthesis C-methylase UbiE
MSISVSTESGKIKKTKGYLHGYSAREQSRLHKQARFLEEAIYHTIDFSQTGHLLEIGCGVGAQTAILLRRFPHLRITAVDAERKQISAARDFLRRQELHDRVKLSVEDAGSLSFKNGRFDGAFLCWLLEHVADPQKIVNEARRVLKPGAVIYCSEVLNASLFLTPHCPATLRYWKYFNRQQLGFGGDPFVGAKLGNLLKNAGFKNIQIHPHVFHFDGRAPEKRQTFLKYWLDLLNSGAPALLESGRVDRELVNKMNAEMKSLIGQKDAVFFYTFMQARGYA